MNILEKIWLTGLKILMVVFLHEKEDDSVKKIIWLPWKTLSRFKAATTREIFLLALATDILKAVLQQKSNAVARQVSPISATCFKKFNLMNILQQFTYYKKL